MKFFSFSLLLFLPPLLTASETSSAQPLPAGTFWSLIPPLLAIILALMTKEVYSSLFAGIILGGCLITGFSPLKTMDVIVKSGLIEAVKTTAGIFIFLVILGILVALINKSGATAAFGKWAEKRIKSRTGAMLTTSFLGILIFIDDYFNCLTVGSVMAPVTDAKKISRAKLAYIIDATAAPVCMIAPVSSWAAAVSQYVDSKEYSGIELFIKAIPYNFYSLLTLCFLFMVILLKIDYGPMSVYERQAATAASSAQTEKNTNNSTRGKISDMLVPVMLLIVFCTLALLYSGGILDGKTLTRSLSDTDTSSALPGGAILTLICSLIYLLIRKTVSFKTAMECIPHGFSAMISPILILTLAASLKNMTSLLKAENFIRMTVGETAAAFSSLLPVVIFITASLLAFSTGTSWGTFGILIPIVAGIFPVDSPLLYIGISACLAGAVCGDHCSPISDTTIMSSAGAGCDHMIHVSTQLPYAITVAVISAIGFLFAGFIQNWFIVFLGLVLLMAGMLIFLKYFVILSGQRKENGGTQ